jgi:hypothetical protein
MLFGLLLGAFSVRSAQAQQMTPTNALAPQELAKSTHNPFEDFVKLPFESDTGFSIGPHHNAGESLSLTPVLPFHLNADWDLIARPNLAITYEPSPHEQFGLNDSQVSLFLTPHRASEWIWGVGPILQLPTATSDGLGTGRWSAGPTAALIYSDGPWFNGILTYQLMSFAGNREAVSTRLISNLSLATTSRLDGTSISTRPSLSTGRRIPPTAGPYRWAGMSGRRSTMDPSR